MTLRRATTAFAVAVGLLACLLILFVATSKKGLAHYYALIPPEQVACPRPDGVLALLVIGQSQAANTGEVRMIPSNRQSYAFSGGVCWQLQDPVVGPPEKGGSIWPAFADAYGAPVLIANLAVSGSSITLWNTPHQREKVRATLVALKRAGYRPVIVWMNGETDAADRMSADEYLQRLDVIAQDTGDAPWFISRESRCYDISEKYLPLEDARVRFVSADPSRRKLGPDLDTLGNDLRNADHCHLARDGQRTFGRMMAERFREVWTS